MCSSEQLGTAQRGLDRFSRAVNSWIFCGSWRDWRDDATKKDAD